MKLKMKYVRAVRGAAQILLRTAKASNEGKAKSDLMLIIANLRELIQVLDFCIRQGYLDYENFETISSQTGKIINSSSRENREFPPAKQYLPSEQKPSKTVLKSRNEFGVSEPYGGKC